MTALDEGRLLDAYTQEALENKELSIVLDLSLDVVVPAVVGLQLALRHPGFSGPSAHACRALIAHIIADFQARGLVSIAQVLKMGNDPAYDKLT